MKMAGFPSTCSSLAWSFTRTRESRLVEFLGGQFTEIDCRFDQVDGRIAELRREMLGNFEEIYRRLERMEQ